MKAHKLSLSVMTMAYFLTGCALQQKLEQASQDYKYSKQSIVNNHAAFAKGLSDKQLQTSAQEVNKPWIVGKSQPLSRTLTLPLALRNQVNTTLLFSDSNTDLRKIARRISKVTGIAVYVRPDALLPQSYFLPKLRTENIGLVQQNNDDYDDFEFTSGPEPLAHILDRLSSYLGVSWRYQNNRIEFYRTETRVFNVQALSLNAETDAALGLGRERESTGFVSSSNTSLKSNKQDLMQTVYAKLEPFLTQSGLIVAQTGSDSSVVITDTPEVLERIADYIQSINKSLTRRVRLVFEELTVALNEKDHASIDWNLVFSGATVAAAGAMPALAGETSASLGLGIVRDKFAGSEALIRSLGESVRLVRHSSVPMMTLNRRPVTHAIRTTFSYIDKIETSPITGANGLAVPAVSVNQKEETVGSLLTLVPDVQDDGRILLSFAYDNTVAQPLKSITFGDKANPLQLQQLSIEGNGTVQQLALQPGQPLIVSGFDRAQTENTKRRLSSGLPAIFGGGDQLNTERLTTLLVITAQIEEGL